MIDVCLQLFFGQVKTTSPSACSRILRLQCGHLISFIVLHLLDVSDARLLSVFDSGFSVLAGAPAVAVLVAPGVMPLAASSTPSPA